MFRIVQLQWESAFSDVWVATHSSQITLGRTCCSDRSAKLWTHFDFCQRFFDMPVTNTTSHQSNLRRAASQRPHWLQLHPQTAPSPLTITTPSNTPIPWPTPLTAPNGIRICSAICHNTPCGQTDRLTDRLTYRQMVQASNLYHECLH